MTAKTAMASINPRTKGKTWLRINDDQHKFGNLNPKYITGDSNVYGRVYFCTDGRGIVMGDIAS